jgi:dTDP-4-dehydrorhamnose reductase
MEKKINILVTGANGQLGSELRFLSKNYPNFNFTFTDVDDVNISKVGEIEHFVKDHPTHVIVNCAAYTAVDKAESDREMAFLINATAVDYLVDAARQSNASLIHVSTDYVFDGTQNTPYTEDDVAIPETAYGQTKYEGENLILYSDINGMVIRTSWLYSTFGNNFVKTMLRLSKEKDSLNVVFDQVGTPTYARDLAQAILDIVPQVHARKDKTQEVYHYTNEGVTSWYDLAVEIFRYKKIACKVNPVGTTQFPTPAKRPAFSVLNKAKIKHQFSLSIPHWIDSLHQMLDDL